ncbi:MAG: hypothetical protein QW803_06605 [Candidatus Methanomethylicia archaeon]
MSRIYLALLTLLLIVLATLKCSAEDLGNPIALGFGGNERYVLYSNGEIHKLLSQNRTEPLSKISFISRGVEYSIIDFEIYEQYLYLYLYVSPTEKSGKTIIAVYNLTSGEEIYMKTYEFTVTQQNQVLGEMIQAASACRKGFAIIKANTTHALIEAYRIEQGGIRLKAVYSGRMAMTLHRYGDTLIAASFKIEIKNGKQWITPQIVDIMENQTLLELPSLVPVAALAYPFIQVFNKNGVWESYVSVYNPIMKRIEYYVAYPEKFYELEGPVKVSSYMDYVILDQKTVSKIIFRNGQDITVNQKLSIIPQGVYLPLNPKNGILDVDVEGNALLVRVVEEDKAKILYITGKSVSEIYVLNASSSMKTEGFYAVLVGDTVYILNPENHKLTSITLNMEVKTNNSLLVVIVVFLAILAIMYCKAKYGRLKSKH